MDAPAEVIAAAGRYRTAATEFADGIARTLRGLAVPRHESCPLDREFVSRLEWITTTLGAAAVERAARVADTHTAMVASVRALEEADETGAGVVRRTGLDS